MLDRAIQRLEWAHGRARRAAASLTSSRSMTMMHRMRTTVTIDDDLAAKIEDMRRREGLSFREALDRLLRRALLSGATPPRPRKYRTAPRKLGLRAGIDATKLNQLVDELEVDDFEASVRR